ncbi:TetR/AcrR family transcriptional regulator [Azospirillum sp. YIM B02556]|uniref:TetR/AcrR family transcriptional regulator n=1 Tax=Azospirillum endophyticum TaxID=2800326 RepID=A0ABS1F0V4_9PROT|nr:TetR/AcrR family transcriptional regulator [Azospirillum endophyticum]MBK1837045.1 TetR/AcrR family transcriptional regulator [Azospirillum endophyticum]
MSTDVRHKVRDAAIALFAQKGVKATTVRDIARSAGVSEGALYRHWPSKEELAADLFAAEYTAMSQSLRDAAGAGPAPERLRRVIGHAFHLAEAAPDRTRFLLLSQHESLPLVPKDQETPVDVICGIVADGIAEGSIVPADRDALSHIVIGAIVMTVQSHVYGRQTAPLSTLAGLIADAILTGIATPADTSRTGAGQ